MAKVRPCGRAPDCTANPFARCHRASKRSEEYIGRLALEIDPENAPAHKLIARNFTGWKQAVEACLRAAGLPKPDEVATFVLTVMEGGVMQARAYRDIAPFDACVRQLRLHLAAAADAPRPRAVVKRRSRRS